MNTGGKKIDLTVYLAKEECCEVKDLLKPDVPFSMFSVNTNSDELGTLYLMNSHSTPPRWTSLFSGIVTSDQIGKNQLPDEISSNCSESVSIPIDKSGSLRLDDHLNAIERSMIVEALSKAGGIQARAAEVLGISQRSLWHRVKKYEIDTEALKGKH